LYKNIAAQKEIVRNMYKALRFAENIVAIKESKHNLGKKKKKMQKKC